MALHRARQRLAQVRDSLAALDRQKKDLEFEADDIECSRREELEPLRTVLEVKIQYMKV